MKVFVYKKSDSTTVEIIKDVKVVYESNGRLIVDTDNETHIFYTKEVKTRCYQN